MSDAERELTGLLPQIRRDKDGPVFAEPWQAQAFAMAVKLHEEGVFTWPDARRHGLAAAGVSELCRRAFLEGADHVQLAVVEGNEAAEGLYAGLGFRTYARLRTLLFA